jgi:hypothetical protein
MLRRFGARYAPGRTWRRQPELATEFVVVVVIRFLAAALSFHFGRRLASPAAAINSARQPYQLEPDIIGPNK